jgi:hypothetical protein
MNVETVLAVQHADYGTATYVQVVTLFSVTLGARAFKNDCMVGN